MGTRRAAGVPRLDVGLAARRGGAAGHRRPGVAGARRGGGGPLGVDRELFLGVPQADLPGWRGWRTPACPRS
ncbi:hypothetical protein V2I01_36955 [Micromonospora sp. BRA006-A]|nr:hypothetical protein [Micromonospora sp. BRA006-A]